MNPMDAERAAAKIVEELEAHPDGSRKPLLLLAGIGNTVQQMELDPPYILPCAGEIWQDQSGREWICRSAFKVNGRECRFLWLVARKHTPDQERAERLKADTLLLLVTPTQAEYLRAIHELTKSNGYPPSVRQIGIKLGRSSSDTVQKALEVLKAKGLVTWKLGARRTLTITEAGQRYLETHPKEAA